MEGITITKKYTSGKTENMLEGQSEAGHEITTKKCHKRGSNTRVKHSFECLLQILINGIILICNRLITRPEESYRVANSV
jgi:hypothetical protein